MSFPHVLVLEPVQFDIFISDVDASVECTLSKFADHTKLARDAGLPLRGN